MACRTHRKPIKKMPIGGIIASLAQMTNQMADASKVKAESKYINEEGNITNRGALQRNYAATSFFNPLQTLKDPNLTGGQKLLQMAAPGVGSFLTAGSRMDRQEQETQKAAIAQRRSQYEGSGIPTQFNTPLLPLGGLIPYNEETVELENGEPFMTPDGQIEKIADGAPGHAQGGVQITLPSGTKVLGKKPATDEKTFKELGSKLEKQQSKYQKILDDKPTRIEEETATRMLAKINKEFNNLFEVQGEDTQVDQQFPNGGAITTERGVSTPYYRNISSSTFEQQLLRKNILKPGYDTLSVPQINEQIREGYNISEGFALPYQAVKGDSGITYQKDFGRNIGEIYDPSGSGEIIDTYNKPRTTFAEGGATGFGSTDLYDPTLQYAPELTDYSSQVQYTPRIGGSQFTPYDVETPQFSGNEVSQSSGGFNAGNTLSTIGSLAPSIYNLYQGLQKPEQSATNAFRNPYESEIRATMRDRRYNITPELEAARLGEATYARRLREGAPTQAQYLGGLQAGAIGSQRQIGQVLARKQNIENQYLGEQAQVDLSLGQAEISRQQYIEDINARSRAAQRQFTSTGVTQLGQFAQIQQQQNNQMVRDAQRLNLLPSLVQNFQFNSDGTWTFKKTGEIMQPDEVWDFVKGTNINK